MMKGGGKEKMKEGERVEEQEETPCILSHRKTESLPPDLVLLRMDLGQTIPVPIHFLVLDSFD